MRASSCSCRSTRLLRLCTPQSRMRRENLRRMFCAIMLKMLQTNMSIIDVALACGFVSASHFSKCYRDFFGRTPRKERGLPADFAPAGAATLAAASS